MIQKPLSISSIKAKQQFYDMVKIRLIIIGNVNVFTVFEYIYFETS